MYNNLFVCLFWQAMKLDLDYKEEQINSLTKEIEELNAGGASEEEVTILKRQRQDLENRLKDQEEELDDLAGQVQMLEAAKTKLEMSMAAIKKEHRWVVISIHYFVAILWCSLLVFWFQRMTNQDDVIIIDWQIYFL